MLNEKCNVNIIIVTYERNQTWNKFVIFELSLSIFKTKFVGEFKIEIELNLLKFEKYPFSPQVQHNFLIHLRAANTLCANSLDNIRISLTATISILMNC